MSRLALGCYLWCCLALSHADTFVRDDLILDPQPERFSICLHGTCADMMVTGLTDEEWQIIRDLAPRLATPAEERAYIRQAIARFEQFVGARTGTAIDKAGTFGYLGEQGQLDCIDESTNTSFYLSMLQDAGLLRWHTVEDRVTRGFFIFGWPHTTAVIREQRSGELYAVDSWFEDNGEPPHILPLEQWRDGWKPEGFADGW